MSTGVFRPSFRALPPRASPFATLTAAAGGAVAYTVTLDPSAYTFTGQAVAAVTSRKATLTAAAYAVTATALTVNAAYRASLTAATYAVSGSALTAVSGRIVTLSAASYAFTGAAVAALTARKVTLSASSFAVAGADLTTLLSRKAVLAPASFAYTGLDLTVAASVQLDYAVTLTAASFAYTGASLTADVTVVTPPVVVSTAGTTGGGGGAAQFYRGKRRHEIRRTIRAALRELEGTKSTRSRKRKARRIAQALVVEFGVIEFAPVLAEAHPPLPLQPLVDLQRRVFDLMLALRAREAATAENAQRLAQLFAEYEAEAARLEQQEDEEAIAMILAVAA